jgi:hypothetical protein
MGDSPNRAIFPMTSVATDGSTGYSGAASLFIPDFSNPTAPAFPRQRSS